MTMWRAVSGFPNYEVSDTGQVRSLLFNKVRVLRPGHGGGDYASVVLWRDGRGITQAVHCLVAAAFIGPRPTPTTQVRHLDGNPRNNTVGNLAYGTPSENAKDAVRHGRNICARKTHCPSGHPYDEANTYTPPSRPGQRYCRACNRARYQKAKETAA